MVLVKHSEPAKNFGSFFNWIANAGNRHSRVSRIHASPDVLVTSRAHPTGNVRDFGIIPFLRRSARVSDYWFVIFWFCHWK